MKIVYLIGNGFDLNLGLKTSYRDFYKKYIKQKSNSDVIENFKTELKEDLYKEINKWSDFELAFGQYAKEFGENKTKYLELYDDVVDSLYRHIKGQNKKFEITNEDETKLKKDLFNFEGYLSKHDKQNLQFFKNKYGASSYFIDVISFNYTQTFENLFNYDNKPIPISKRGSYENILKSVIHIHGTTNKDLVLGVYDKTQIHNMMFQQEQEILNAMIKSEIYKNIGHMLDVDGFKAIKEADIICVFGMSFGETDKGWWNAILNRLINSSTKLIVFGKSKKSYRIQGYRNETEKIGIKDHIFSFKKLTADEKNKIKDQIVICLDSNMFKLTNGSKIIKNNKIKE